MECLGVEPGAAWWKAQTNPLSYGGTPTISCLVLKKQMEVITWPKTSKEIEFFLVRKIRLQICTFWKVFVMVK